MRTRKYIIKPDAVLITRKKIQSIEKRLYDAALSSLLTRYERSKLRFDLSDLREDLAGLLGVEAFSVDGAMHIAESEEEQAAA